MIVGGVLAAIGIGIYIYREGAQSERTSQLITSLEETHQSLKDREDAEDEVRNTVDVDALLVRLGIMRQPTDY